MLIWLLSIYPLPPINIPNLLRYLPQMEHLGQAIVIAGAISALVFHHEQRPVLSLATKSG